MPYPELEELYNTYRTDLYRYLCPLPQSAAGRAGGQVGFYQRFTFRAGYAVLHQRHQVAADRAGDFFDFGSFFHRS